MIERRPIRVFIADDFDIMRQMMHKLLERAEDVEVIGEAPHLSEALQEAILLQPDVILMNDYLPPIDSAHAAEHFRAQGINSAILIASMHMEADLIRRSFDSGVNGFMHKDEMGEHLVEAVQAVYRGQRYLSPKANQALKTED